MTRLRTRFTGSDTNSTDGPTALVVGDTFATSAVAQALADVAAVRVATDDRRIATRTDGIPVCLATEATVEHDEVELSGETTLHPGVLPDSDTLDAAGAADADVAVVAMSTEAGSLLVTQLLRTRFDTADVVTVVEDPRSVDTFADLAPVTVCVANLVASTVESTLDERFPATEQA